VPQSIGQIVSSGLLPGLTPGAPYLIQIRAVDPNGLESPVPAAVQITGAPPIAGGAGTSLTVVSTTGTSVTLSWMPVPGATFMVLQSSSPSGPFAPAITSAVSGNGAMVTGLQPNVTYYFQVVPIDALGNQGAPSNIASATTSGGPPAATPRVSVGALTATSAALSWTPIPLAAGYQVLQATNPTGPFIPASMVNAGPSGATVVNLMPGTLYYFQVIALDGAGNQLTASSPIMASTSTSGGPITATTVPAPTGLTVQATTASTATLTWSPSNGAIGYQVLQATSPTGPFAPVTSGSVMTTGATVTGLSPNTTYFFEV